MVLQQKNRLLWMILLWSFVISIKGESQEVCSIPNAAFQGGEELVFKAYYNWGFIWIPAGEAIFKVNEYESYYEVFVKGSSYKAYDGFFKLRDRFYTKIDKESMLPITFERVVLEGDYKKYERIDFNQADQMATTYIGDTKEDAKTQHFDITHCMHDLLSLLYFMRNINVDEYEVGEHIPTKIFFDRLEYDVKVRYAQKEENKEIRDLGRFNTILVVPDLIAGTVFNEGDKSSSIIITPFLRVLPTAGSCDISLS